MSTANHISFEEFTGNSADVLNKVREEHKPIVVEYATGEKVLIKPLPMLKKNLRKKIRVNYAAIEASAGSWSDVDTDILIKQIYESRTITTRPLADL